MRTHVLAPAWRIFNERAFLSRANMLLDQACVKVTEKTRLNFTISCFNTVKLISGFYTANQTP